MNEGKMIEPENQSPAEQTPGDHGVVGVRRPYTEVLVDPEVEYQRPTDSESAPPKHENTSLVDDPSDPSPQSR